MSKTTREQFLSAAEHLFAERGFYGASIAAIAEELGLTKQALLHHFGSKEKLYGEVLQHLSDQTLERTREIADSDARPEEKFEAMILAQYRGQMEDEDAARLIMRELLDNERRAETASNWYLKPYLDSLVDTALSCSALSQLDRTEAFALVYQLLGAAHYFAVSQPTLAMIVGKDALAETRKRYEGMLRTLVRARLEA